MLRASLVLLGSTLALTACAPTPSGNTPQRLTEASRRCTFADTINGYSLDGDTLYVRAGSSVFQVDTAQYCPSLDSGMALGIQAERGSSQICVGDWISIHNPSRSAAFGPCRARVAKSLTPEEVAALPAKARP